MPLNRRSEPSRVPSQPVPRPPRRNSESRRRCGERLTLLGKEARVDALVVERPISSHCTWPTIVAARRQARSTRLAVLVQIDRVFRPELVQLPRADPEVVDVPLHRRLRSRTTIPIWTVSVKTGARIAPRPNPMRLGGSQRYAGNTPSHACIFVLIRGEFASMLGGLGIEDSPCPDRGSDQATSARRGSAYIGRISSCRSESAAPQPGKAGRRVRRLEQVAAGVRCRLEPRVAGREFDLVLRPHCRCCWGRGSSARRWSACSARRRAAGTSVTGARRPSRLCCARRRSRLGCGRAQLCHMAPRRAAACRREQGESGCDDRGRGSPSERPWPEYARGRRVHAVDDRAAR